MYCRTFVQVLASFNEEGLVMPISIHWHDRELTVDRVLDRRPAAATKAGGQGMRYTVRIGSHETYLFQDDQQRWFVEEKSDVHKLPRVPGGER